MISIKEKESLSLHTTFKVGGVASYFVEINSPDELEDAVNFSEEKKLKIFILGGGSNTVFNDGTHDILLLKISIPGIKIISDSNNERLVFFGAGEKWTSVVSYSIQNNLWGAENLSGIPGSVGGACVQNIGAYGVEFSEIVKEISVYDYVNKKILHLKKDDCGFGYRQSIFKNDEGKKYIVLGATVVFSKKPDPKISYKDLKLFFGEKMPKSSAEISEAVISIRSKKFPNLEEFGTAGSFFKNPVISKEKFEEIRIKYPDIVYYEVGEKIKLSLAWILDKILDLKGFEEFGVMLWKDQPIVIAARKNVSAEKIILFSEKIKNIVKEKIGIEISNEVIVI